MPRKLNELNSDIEDDITKSILGDDDDEFDFNDDATGDVVDDPEFEDDDDDVDENKSARKGDDRSDEFDDEEDDDDDDAPRSRDDKSRRDELDDADERRGNGEQAADLAEVDIYQRFDEDQHGNLLYNGRILVKKGRPRQIFDRLRKEALTNANTTNRAMHRLNELATQTKSLYDRYIALRDKPDYGKTLQLEDTEVKDALELFAMAKTDAKGAIRKILTRAHMSGTDLSDLGITGPVDAQEVAAHTMRLQEQQRQAEERRKQATAPVAGDQNNDPAVQEATKFLSANPQAINYINAIGSAKQQFPERSYEEIWQALVKYMKKGDNRGQTRRQSSRPTDGARPSNRGNSNTNRRSTKKRGRLDITPRDPSQSVEQIGEELLRDLKNLEERG